jgi:hypothetical protein
MRNRRNTIEEKQDRFSSFFPMKAEGVPHCFVNCCHRLGRGLEADAEGKCKYNLNAKKCLRAACVGTGAGLGRVVREAAPGKRGGREWPGEVQRTEGGRWQRELNVQRPWGVKDIHVFKKQSRNPCVLR